MLTKHGIHLIRIQIMIMSMTDAFQDYLFYNCAVHDRCDKLNGIYSVLNTLLFINIIRLIMAAYV